MTTIDQPALPNRNSVILRLNGVPTAIEEGMVGEGFFLDSIGSWRSLTDDGLYEVGSQCAYLQDELAAKIFGSLSDYQNLQPFAPSFVVEAGLNSESLIGRNEFEQLLQTYVKLPELNRSLYFYDCCMLVSAIQECTKEVSQLTGEFYRILNLEPFFTPGVRLDDGIRWSTSPTVTNLNAILSFLFIRMHSLLDYLAKLAMETENLRTNFSTYPKLASSKFLFGQRNRLAINDRKGSLFESCKEVQEVESVRNLLIHDGLLDDVPKAYEVIRNGVTIERFVLMPDRTNGQFERFKNRRLFYSREDKISLRLASLVRGFQSREVETLKGIQDNLAALY
uniref:hypothetical protein n=1 Tax=Pseudomonas sp. Z003-0.4C(8344-21) TaxID=1855380 RepID=UPI0012FE2F01|nr:hypothetical protein [Pseudomonas sp. Z003-0.4C(8344-21)]